MKRLLFTLLLFGFIGFAQGVDPPDQVTTFASEIEVNKSHVLNGWNVTEVTNQTIETGSFVCITYEREPLVLAYCSKMVSDYNPINYANFRREVLNTSESEIPRFNPKPNKTSTNFKRVLHATAGGEPQLYKWA